MSTCDTDHCQKQSETVNFVPWRQIFVGPHRVDLASCHPCCRVWSFGVSPTFEGKLLHPCSEPYLILIFGNRKKFYDPSLLLHASLPCIHATFETEPFTSDTIHIKQSGDFSASQRIDVRPINTERNCYISRFKSSRRIRNNTDSFLQLLENDCLNRKIFSLRTNTDSCVKREKTNKM